MPTDLLNQDLIDVSLARIAEILHGGRPTHPRHGDQHFGHYLESARAIAQSQLDTAARAGKCSGSLSKDDKVLDTLVNELSLKIGWKANSRIIHKGFPEYHIIPWNSKRTFHSNQDMADSLSDVSPTNPPVYAAMARSMSIS